MWRCTSMPVPPLSLFSHPLHNSLKSQVYLHIPAGHAGWLGWSANIGPAATLFASVYKNASAPASLRGLATNVANYNAWTVSPCPSYTSGDANCDEQLYVNALAPLLASQGWSAHFITDTGTSSFNTFPESPPPSIKFFKIRLLRY